MKNVRDTFQDRAMVSVKVHPALKEYILAINCGSDIIIPQVLVGTGLYFS